MKLESLDKLLEDQLKDIYSAENQVLKVLPKLAKKASTPKLREALQSHLEETKSQIDLLNDIGSMLDIRLSGKKCKAMDGLLEEATELIDAEGESLLIDSALIAAVQKIEHYEISAYGSARAVAAQLGHFKVVELLQESLDEEATADERLSVISEEDILPHCGGSAQDEDELDRGGIPRY